MIRPSRRLLALGIAALSLTAVTVAFGPYPAGAVVAWSAVAAVVLADLLLSPGSRRVAVTARAPAELFTGDEGDIVVSVGGWRGGALNRLRGRLACPEGLGDPGEALASGGGIRNVADVRTRPDSGDGPGGFVQVRFAAERF